MEQILYLAHTESDGSLSKTSLETLQAALNLEAELKKASLPAGLIVGLIGENTEKAANLISGCKASNFYSVSGSEFGVSRYASDAAAAEALIKTSKATIVIAPASARFARALPGAACRCEGRVDTHISGFEIQGSELCVQRWYYRQRIKTTLSRAQRPWILLCDSGIAQAWQGQSGSATVQNVPVQLSESQTRTKVLGLESPSSGTQTINPDAGLLLVAGAGWTKKQSDGQIHAKEAEGIIKDFISNANASLGSSKSLVDQGSEGEAVLSILSHLNQVGQTGSTPRHAKGLSTCCHGEEPHVVGWRFINERRAINLDANCGWAHGKADVLYVTDAFEVMKKVNELLK
jgi:electron transfer flavoprotein alpha subunit